MERVPSLKTLVLKYVCSNIDTLFHQKLVKIRTYLKERQCEDITDLFIDDQEFITEEHRNDNGTPNANSNSTALGALRNFVKSRDLPKIVWKVTTKNTEVNLGLTVDSISVTIDGQRCQARARSLAAKLMLRKLSSRYLTDSILSQYRTFEKTYQRAASYKSESGLCKTTPAITVEGVDELIGYEFNEEERYEILRNIPEYKLRRSHYILLLYRDDKTLDFSFCPSLFSAKFFKLLLRKAKGIDTVNLEHCNKSVSGYSCVTDIVKMCRHDIMRLYINKCQFVGVDNIFRMLWKYQIDLKDLSVSGTIKNNVVDYMGFHNFFNSPRSGRLIKLDLSTLSLCDEEISYILTLCKRLVYLNLADTKHNTCYCKRHSTDITFETTVITKLKELNISNSDYREKILTLLVENNPGLDKLYAASSTLCTTHLDSFLHSPLPSLTTLDIAFQGVGAYEDFSLYKYQLPSSLRTLDASGFCVVDVSYMVVACPNLSNLIVNISLIDLTMSCAVKDINNKLVEIPHTIQHFNNLTRLELRYTDIHTSLDKLMECGRPVPLRELILEGDCLTDSCLTYIVNSVVTDEHGRTEFVFRSLYLFHICNCNNVTDFGIRQGNFKDMPSLTKLTIERCSAIRRGTLVRLQAHLKDSKVSLTCFVNDERPKFHPMKNIEVVMG